MNNHYVINQAVVGVAFVSLFLGGCALQPGKSNVPAQLEREIKSIEGQKTTTYQPPVSGKSSPPFGKGREEGFPDGKTTYIVKKGDTLWRISKNYGISTETILRANHITNTRDLKVGQKLIIPASGKSHESFVSRSNYTSTGSGMTGGVSSLGFIWPVKGQVVSQFGEVRNGARNTGIYILPNPGQKIVAAKKGVVEAITDAEDGTHVIIVKHDGGSRTIYGCPDNPIVGEGSYVEQGQPITGFNKADTIKPREVNFKIYVKDKPVNPMSYLP